jgi:hypothetical protein
MTEDARSDNPLVISLHGRQQAEERGIAEETIREIVDAPDQIVAERDGRWCYQSKRLIRGREFLIRVFVKETSTTRIVLTTYRTTNIDKYWQTKRRLSR